VTDIGGLFRRAFRINQHRQIAGDAGRIHVVEKIGTMAEQILDIVLGGREHDVDAGLVHQAIKAMMVERDRESLGGLSVDVHESWPPARLSSAV
jgi:hypothetical protein